MHDNLFSTIKQNLAEGLYVGVQYLTHKEIISHQKLVLEYVKIGFELFKEFFSTVLSNTGRDLSAFFHFMIGFCLSLLSADLST